MHYKIPYINSIAVLHVIRSCYMSYDNKYINLGYDISSDAVPFSRVGLMLQPCSNWPFWTLNLHNPGSFNFLSSFLSHLFFLLISSSSPQGSHHHKRTSLFLAFELLVSKYSRLINQLLDFINQQDKGTVKMFIFLALLSLVHDT